MIRVDDVYSEIKVLQNNYEKVDVFLGFQCEREVL